MSRNLPTVLITGASSGIGAVYADRFAHRGHDLVLVARGEDRMEALAPRLRAKTGVSIDILPADLIEAADLSTVEKRLREDDKIGILVNNAGAAAPGGVTNPDLDAFDRLIRLNVTAVTRLASVAGTRFASRGEGAVVNISSISGADPGVPTRNLRRDQILCADVVAIASVRTGSERSLRSSSLAGRDAD